MVHVDCTEVDSVVDLCRSLTPMQSAAGVAIPRLSATAVAVMPEKVLVVMGSRGGIRLEDA